MNFRRAEGIINPDTGSSIDVFSFFRDENQQQKEQQQEDNEEELFQLPNKLISRHEVDFLYHLGLVNDGGLVSLVKDVRFVCMGGSAERAKKLAQQLQDRLHFPKDQIGDLQPIGKTDRFSMYKVGPVISVSHGMGMPSMSILLHEISKLLYFGKARKDVIFIRVGTSGGLGLNAGTVVVAEEGLNSKMKAEFKTSILGKNHRFSTRLDGALAQLAVDVASDEPAIPCTIGKTLGTDDFFEGQGRLDGALLTHTEQEKFEWLNLLHDHGVRNIEMEAPKFAAFCNRTGVRGLLCCTTLLNRLLGDQVTATPDELAEYSSRAQEVATRLIGRLLQQ